MDITPGNSYVLINDTNFESTIKYMDGLYSYWINKIDEYKNTVEQELINQNSSYTVNINFVNVNSTKYTVKSYYDSIVTSIKTYTLKVTSKLHTKFKQFLTIYSSYIQGKDYRPYLNSDLPVPPTNAKYLDLRNFFSVFDEVYFPNYDEIFKLSYSTTTTSYGTTKFITVSIICSLTSIGSEFKSFLTNMLELDESRIDDFIKWFQSLTYAYDLSLWIIFKEDKIPNQNISNLKPLKTKLLEDYHLKEIIDFYKFNIPGV